MKKIVALLFIVLFVLNGYSQKAKPTIKKPSNAKPMVIECTDFKDNPEKFIGKQIIFSVYYSSNDNGGLGLRESESNYERILPYTTFNVSSVENHHLRKLACDGTFIVQIPIEVHSKLPNLKDGYIAILGFVNSNKRITLLNAVRN